MSNFYETYFLNCPVPEMWLSKSVHSLRFRLVLLASVTPISLLGVFVYFYKEQFYFHVLIFSHQDLSQICSVRDSSVKWFTS